VCRMYETDGPSWPYLFAVQVNTLNTAHILLRARAGLKRARGLYGAPGGQYN